MKNRKTENKMKLIDSREQWDSFKEPAIHVIGVSEGGMGIKSIW